MYETPTRLPHLLTPQRYFSATAHREETEALFRRAWHLVATREELARPGNFITCRLLGQPIQVRNFDGELRALSNVCAHRHCLLTSRRRGKSPRMECQYHGWEYRSDGTLRRLPAVRDFLPLDREALRLSPYRVTTCGGLVFVSLAPAGEDLEAQLGDLYPVCARRFGPDWRACGSWEFTYDANWKVPVENSLEAYHVPHVHPASFGRDPGEERTEHHLAEGGTAMTTRLPFNRQSVRDTLFQRCEGWVVGRLQGSVSDQYRQHHVYPNLLFSFTDAISLVHAVFPTGPRTSRALVWQYGRIGPRPLLRPLGRAWSALKVSITGRILHEDLELLPAIQEGLEASPHAGMLGRSEERIHAFHRWILDRLTAEQGESLEAAWEGDER